MSDEKPKRMSKEAFALACHDWDDDDQRTVRAEALRARASEKRLAEALRAAAERLGEVGHDRSCSAPVFASVHPSKRPACDCGHDDAARAVDAAISEVES